MDPHINDADFTHFDEKGRVQMVDVTEKAVTSRKAVAVSRVVMKETTREKIEQRQVKKGDVLSVAELAGVMASKRTSDLVPLCHPIPLTKVNVETAWLDDWNGSDDQACLEIQATVTADYKTGVEMEALTASTVAALTVYDMCKALDRGMAIADTRLLFKTGGKSGTYRHSGA
ncbi:cyclic pyranopterin monophosphate synthase MoaC [Alicyclobacillus sp. SO9]|uniref:cyclic pyranopterin monophosphate synthase MoaC n=1 Tax=Alicyclobacillus sp. SO9 TaxID=2665646 RepID=UPI0018E8135F|nr:cyclic pyranopterin monophosphate synthase MoaC [Alicyclobacillus sp. SO9]QQE76931.1 cyclic pyranopterin monophosphate synthase MoaC [Alicyclobacillus sp. SO9]